MTAYSSDSDRYEWGFPLVVASVQVGRDWRREMPHPIVVGEASGFADPTGVPSLVLAIVRSLASRGSGLMTAELGPACHSAGRTAVPPSGSSRNPVGLSSSSFQ